MVAACKVCWCWASVCALERLACSVKGADQRSKGSATTEHHWYRASSSTEHNTGSAASNSTIDGIVLLAEVCDSRVSVRENASHGG